jgi:hypothetical protein
MRRKRERQILYAQISRAPVMQTTLEYVAKCQANNTNNNIHNNNIRERVKLVKSLRKLTLQL